ncbi:MAG: beta-hydroxyacyl-ACP dehydratase [Planctomycetes bacterium]|nr:beta-hydroxyacyl-ACP dehydratase [Planctomycetota bacterium]
MASTPLIDLDSLDLSKVLVGPQDLDAYLKQTGRFRMLEGILHQDVENGLMVGYRDITADDWWAKDHIPGRPLFPGALQIEAAAQLSAYDYSAHRCDGPLAEDAFVGFAGVDKARFRGSVEPACRLYLITKLLRSSKRMFRYQAQAIANGKMVFEAEILGVVF